MIIQVSLLLLPVAATCGWLWGRQEKNSAQECHNPHLRREFFQGLNYLIDDKPDKAVDVFVQLVDIDADTVETHLALGNLFRRRGEVDRAIRVHQNLIARPQLPQKTRLLALYALAQDYFCAGVLDRAERLLLELLQSKYDEKDVLLLLMRIYEQESEWRKAIQIIKRLQIKKNALMEVTIAQYYCELAEECKNQSESSQALRYLKCALSYDSCCVRANLLCASLAMEQDNYRLALRYYANIEKINKEYLYVICENYVECLFKLNLLPEIKKLFLRYMQFAPELYAHTTFDATALQKWGYVEEENLIRSELMPSSTLYGIERLLSDYIRDTHDNVEAARLFELRSHLRGVLKDNIKYQCQNCGFSSLQAMWQCPSCHQWATLHVKLLIHMRD